MATVKVGKKIFPERCFSRAPREFVRKMG